MTDAPRWLLTGVAQPRVGLQLIDQSHEFRDADDAFELETGAVARNPDQMGLDPADMRQADVDPLTAPKPEIGPERHEPVRRQVDDMQLQIATLPMFGNQPEIDRVPARPTQVGD